jgi:hypothetical protein
MRKKSKVELIEHYQQVSNEELMRDYLDLHLGDGEDGYYSDYCMRQLDVMSNELSDRLMKAGFLTIPISEL